jgi:hypothetical protein
MARGRASRWLRPLIGLAALTALIVPAWADGLRVAVFHTELGRDGPGLLLRDIRSGEDAQVAAVVAVIAAARPDAILLLGIDHDLDLVAAAALADRLEAAGLALPYRFAPRPNTGLPTGLDLDGDGRRGGPRDAQGYGRFAGAAGMLLLSRLPIRAEAARDFTAMPWADLPGAIPPEGTPAVQRLSTTGHWEVPLDLPGGGTLRLLAWAATPPVFDGPEDRNGRRNHDEAAFWLGLIAGALPWPPPEAPFVLLGGSNLDPADGEGRREALAALLALPALQDPAPRGASGRVEPGHRGDPALDTALFGEGTGGLRTELILPSADLRVTGAGVLWPPGSDPFAATVAGASRHRLVWVDIELP